MTTIPSADRRTPRSRIRKAGDASAFATSEASAWLASFRVEKMPLSRHWLKPGGPAAASDTLLPPKPAITTGRASRHLRFGETTR